MKVAPLIGWQTLLADLSLILFMVTAAAMATSPHHAARIAAPPPPPAAEPLAVWRAGGAQPLRRWLAAEQPDARQQLTIASYYRSGGAAHALAIAQALVGEASAMGQVARVIVAPAPAGTAEQTLATLAYDRSPDAGPAG